ncbi:MAG: hypothetical protein KF758_03075 [Anaerolineales bacterium]|nr:hypothetical protein [Anaerolineales bacterium]MBX3035871.1 hypothetical protein [Anaerolineales bacterium]
MDTLTIIAYALIFYGVFTLYIALVKPKAIWNIGKIQGFVQLLSEKGTVLFFSIVGIATIVGGIYLLLN